MKNVLLGLGLCFALLAVAVSIACVGLIIEQRNRVAALETKLDDMRKLFDRKLANAENLADSRLERLQITLDEVRALAEARPASSSGEMDLSALLGGAQGADGALSEQIAKMLGRGEPGQEGDGDSNNMLDLMSNLFESDEMRKSMADMQSNMIIEASLGDFFEDVQLPKETKDAMRQIMSEEYSAAFSEMFSALGENRFDLSKMNDMRADQDAAEDRIHARVAELLTQEEYDLWAAYDDQKEARMMANSYEMQMGMMAPQVNSETRDLFSDVLVEQYMLFRDQAKPSEQMQAMGMDVDPAQMFEGVRQRMAELVDEGQFEHIDRFITQQEQLLAAFSPEMLGEMLKPTASE